MASPTLPVGIYEGLPEFSKKVAALILNAENGLLSRFLFYYMNVQPVWKDVFSLSSEDSLDAYFGKLGAEYFKLYQLLEEQGNIEFCLSAEQKAQFNQFFEQIQGVYISLKGLDYLATVRRLGLTACLSGQSSFCVPPSLLHMTNGRITRDVSSRSTRFTV